MFSLSLLTLVASAVLVRASPITTPALAVDSAALPTPTVPVSEIDVAQCVLDGQLQCCQETFSVPDLGIGSLTSLLPLPTGISLPSLGPLIGVQCSSATDLDILGNKWSVHLSVLLQMTC